MTSLEAKLFFHSLNEMVLESWLGARPSGNRWNRTVRKTHVVSAFRKLRLEVELEEWPGWALTQLGVTSSETQRPSWGLDSKGVQQRWEELSGEKGDTCGELWRKEKVEH
jgi:hypothetical protein